MGQGPPRWCEGATCPVAAPVSKSSFCGVGLSGAPGCMVHLSGRRAPDGSDSVHQCSTGGRRALHERICDWWYLAAQPLSWTAPASQFAAHAHVAASKTSSHEAPRNILRCRAARRKRKTVKRFAEVVTCGGRHLAHRCKPRHCIQDGLRTKSSNGMGRPSHHEITAAVACTPPGRNAEVWPRTGDAHQHRMDRRHQAASFSMPPLPLRSADSWVFRPSRGIC